MSEYDDLIKEFGSSPKGKGIVTPHADLIKEFGSGNVQVAAPVETAQPSYIPSPKSDAEIKASQDKANSISSPQSYKDKLYTDAVSEEFSNSKKLAGQGLNEIGQGVSATGVGNVALGGLGMVVAPFTPLAKGAEDIVNRILPGNPQGKGAGTGEKLLLALPINKGGQAAKITAANLIPSNRAVNKIIETVGPENLAEGIQRMRDNPRLAPADVFPAVRSMAQGLATEVGPHQTKLLKAVEERGGSAKGAVEQAFNSTMGAPVNVLDKINAMKKDIREVGSKEINPVVEGSQPADITKLITNIDKLIADTPVGAATLKALKAGQIPTMALGPTQERLFQLRNEIRGDWTDKPQMFLDVKGDQGLHRIQKDLRYEAQTLLESQGSDKLLGGKLMNVRNQIVEAIDAQHKGKYKEALGKYRDEMHIQDAFDKGQDILKNRPTKYEDNPALWAEWKKNASDKEVKAAQEGARLAIDQQINGMRFAAKKGTDIPEIDFNAQKLKLLFNEKEVKQLFKTLKDEKDIADTNTKIWQGSQTQFREGGQRAIQERPDYQPSLTPFIAPAIEAATLYASGGEIGGLGAAVGGYQLARRQVTKLGQKLDRKTNAEIANLSVATGEAREALMDALSNSLTKGKLTAAQKLQLALPTNP